MDRGAWPFFVDGVTCLVISVSVCEEKREERRERMKEKRSEKIKGSSEKKRHRDETRFFSKKRCFQDPQTRQMNSRPKMFRKKSLSDELFLHFFCKSSESDRFFIYLHDSNSIFGPTELNQNGLGPAQYATRERNPMTVSQLMVLIQFWSNPRSQSNFFYSESQNLAAL